MAVKAVSNQSYVAKDAHPSLPSIWLDDSICLCAEIYSHHADVNMYVCTCSFVAIQFVRTSLRSAWVALLALADEYHQVLNHICRY